MNRIDFYKNAYDTELERRKSIESDLSLPIGVITALLGWLFYFYSNFFPQKKSTFVLTEILFFFCLITLLLSILFVCVSYFAFTFRKSKKGIKKKYSYQYYYLEGSNHYEGYYNKRIKVNNESKSLGTPKSDRDLEEHIIKHLIARTRSNIKINDKKVAVFSFAKALLIINLMLNCLLLSDVIFGHIPKSDNETKTIQVTGPSKLIITDTIPNRISRDTKLNIK